MTSILVETSEGSTIVDRKIEAIKSNLISGVKEAIQEGYDVPDEMKQKAIQEGYFVSSDEARKQILKPVFDLLNAGKYSDALWELEEVLSERHLYEGRPYLHRYLDYYGGVDDLKVFINW